MSALVITAYPYERTCGLWNATNRGKCDGDRRGGTLKACREVEGRGRGEVLKAIDSAGKRSRVAECWHGGVKLHQWHVCVCVCGAL